MVPGWLDELAAQHADVNALVFDDNGTSFTELAKRSRTVAAGLADLGIGSGDVVALWLPNETDWLVAFFACARLGAVVIAVNTRFRAVELAGIFDRVRPKAIVYRPRFRSVNFAPVLADAIAITEAPPPLEIVAGEKTSAGAVSLEELTERQHGPSETSYGGELSERSDLIMFTTSGTTSVPKFVLHSHKSIVHHARDVARDFAMDDSNAAMLQALPYCGVFGFCQAMAALAAGRPSVVMETFEPELAANLISRYAITHFNATDDMLTSLVAVKGSAGLLATLKLVGAASFNRGPDVLSDLAAHHGLPVVGLYGMSEVQALFARRSLNDAPETRFLAGGRPVSTAANMRIRDTENHTLQPAGKRGELELSGPSMMRTYFADDGASAEALTPDGFLRTGDLGVLDNDGSFTFESRMGDALRLGGFLVNPGEISSFLEKIDGIDQCVVIGALVEGKMRAVAFVKSFNDQTFDPDPAMRACRERLAPFKVPAIIHALADFPVVDGPNGIKIQLGRLRELARELVEK